MIADNAKAFNRLALGAVLGGFALLAMAIFSVAASLRQDDRNNQMVEHTYAVEGKLDDMMLMIERAENARRGYLLRPDPDRILTARDASSRVLPLLDEVERLTQDNPAQQRRLDVIRPLILSELGQVDASLDLAEQGQLRAAHERFTHGLNFVTLRKIRALSVAMEAEEHRLLAERQAQERRVQRRIQTIVAGTAVLMLLLVVVTTLLMRRYVGQLNRAGAELAQSKQRLEERVAERTVDLQRANDEIQRFAYIVSHDLRSPLVNIMGFTAELDGIDKILLKHLEQVEASDPTRVPDAVRRAVREDLPEALTFIRSSTAKMDRLINAILTLSREGRRRITPERVALDELVDGIARNLSQLARERGATIRVEPGLPTVVTDRLALDQILSNLVENATKYGLEGRPGEVVVRGRQQGPRVLIEVADNGRGVAPADQERIFDLFRRAGRQDQTGEGIGLANVRALAYRLGGTVTISSVLGEGSVFLVDLPAQLDAVGEGE